MPYGFLADLTVAVHVGYVLFVVVGQLLIWLGLALGWRWVRNPWFRAVHLVMIVIVAYEEFYDIRCPLTVWEEQFRERAGQEFSGQTFMSRVMHDVIFLDLPSSAFYWMHVGCAAVVLGTFVLFPPRRPRFRPAA